MGRKKNPEPNDKEQSARFLDVAKQISPDMDKEAFEQVCGKVLKTPKIKKE